jgi:lysophospholipase L1-like esterase
LGSAQNSNVITAGPATGNAVQFIGRFKDDPAGPVFEWSNSTILGKFTGTGISVTLQELNSQSSYPDGSPGGNIYALSIDGSARTSVPASPGTTTYQLATGLTSGQHTVELVKRTEARVGGARFLGFSIEGGQMMSAARVVTRRLAVIGDSISAGYGVLGGNASCSFTPSTQDVTQTYGAVAASSLQAELTVTAWTGKGVWRNGDGTTNTTMPQLYVRTIPSDYTSVWDPNAWVPDAVVVNLGTNDFAIGVPPANSFKQAYTNLLTSLGSMYPGAHVFCTLGPMLSDTDPAGQMQLSTARGYIQTVVQELNNPRLHFLEFTQVGASQQGCNGHPNVAAQQTMGQQLAQTIRTTLNW